MIILGLTENMHDTSACIVKNGKLLSAIASERISGKKRDGNISIQVVRNLLVDCGLEEKDIDCVVISNDGHDYKYVSVLEKGHQESINQSIIFSPLIKPKLTIRLPHHVCHASAAYYTSNFEEAFALTVDCCDFTEQTATKKNSLACHFKGNKLISEHFPEIFTGIKYARTCEHMDFKPCLDKAGTVMGLSSYGEFKEEYLPILDTNTRSLYPKKDKDLRSCMNMSRTVQDVLEKDLLDAVKKLRDNFNEPHVNNLCLGGGTLLNCNANSKILLSNEFENVHFFPACGDDGLAVGAALFAAHHIFDYPLQKYEPQQICYLGPHYPLYQDPPYEYIAQKIAEGKIVGWMHGRSEFGPRALGNRSIFADPRNQHTRDWINQIVKKREWFRPFAPIVLEEEYQDWFDFPVKSPFMLYTAQVKQPEKIPAVTHVDGSARFQTVSKKSNYHAYTLIEEFKKITGIPVLMNTSLNGKGQPILEHPHQALSFLEDTDIDIMVIQGKVYEK